MLEYITIEPKANANASIIWLHGLGADGHDFADIVPALQLPADLPLRFIFPHAPAIPVTLNQGYVMPAWFDIIDIAIDGRRDIAGMERAVAMIHELIQAEINKGIAPTRLLLAGFSQGAATALMTALAYPQLIAGVLGLSGFLPDLSTLTHYQDPRFPCFLAHGTQDPIVPFTLGQTTKDAFIAADFPVSWHAYPMAHQVCAEEIADISSWIADVLCNKGIR